METGYTGGPFFFGQSSSPAVTFEKIDPNTGHRHVEDSPMAAKAPVTPPLADSAKRYAFHVPEFAKARCDQREKKLPQIIAHRGFKSRFPENSLLAFHEAVKAGATALETDTRLTKDKVVVLSHDHDLKRMFGVQKKISDCMWDEIKNLKTIAQPSQQLARLEDVLEYLQTPHSREIWLLLDVKPNEEEEPIFHQIKSTITEVTCQRPWSERIALGIWAPKHLPLAAEIMPDFPIIHVGFNLSYARRHFQNMSTMMSVETLLLPGGRGLVQDCQKKSAPVMAWTVNEDPQAKWCAWRGLDGIVTDDPSKIAQVWARFDFGREPFVSLTPGFYLHLIWHWYMVNIRFYHFSSNMKLEEYVYKSHMVKDKEI